MQCPYQNYESAIVVVIYVINHHVEGLDILNRGFAFKQRIRC